MEFEAAAARERAVERDFSSPRNDKWTPLNRELSYRAAINIAPDKVTNLKEIQYKSHGNSIGDLIRAELSLAAETPLITALLSTVLLPLPFRSLFARFICLVLVVITKLENSNGRGIMALPAVRRWCQTRIFTFSRFAVPPPSPSPLFSSVRRSSWTFCKRGRQLKVVWIARTRLA